MMNWYYEGKEHDYGDDLPAYLIYATDGISYLIDPFTTEERFFDFMEEKYGTERIHMVIYEQQVSAETFERLRERMENSDRMIAP